MAGVPHVVHTLHGVTFHEHIPAPLRRIYVLMERFAAPYCDVMITVGEDVKHKYLAEAIGHRDQYVTIPSGMDLEPFESARASTEDDRDTLRCVQLQSVTLAILTSQSETLKTLLLRNGQSRGGVQTSTHQYNCFFIWHPESPFLI